MAAALIQPKWSCPGKQRVEQTDGIAFDAVYNRAQRQSAGNSKDEGHVFRPCHRSIEIESESVPMADGGYDNFFGRIGQEQTRAAAKGHKISDIGSLQMGQNAGRIRCAQAIARGATGRKPSGSSRSDPGGWEACPLSFSRFTRYALFSSFLAQRMTGWKACPTSDNALHGMIAWPPVTP
jgi:hypothetical protein